MSLYKASRRKKKNLMSKFLYIPSVVNRCIVNNKYILQNFITQQIYFTKFYLAHFTRKKYLLMNLDVFYTVLKISYSLERCRRLQVISILLFPKGREAMLHTTATL